MRKVCILLLVCGIFLLGGCTTEQTIVRKVNEPMALKPVEQVKPVEAFGGDAMLLSIAPDHQTLLLWDQGALQVQKNGTVSDLLIDIPQSDTAYAASRIVWSPNSRYACWRLSDRALVMDIEKQHVIRMDAVQTACFNADQVTLYYTCADQNGSALYRRKAMSGEEEHLLDIPYTVHGAMFRTTRSQYLVMSDDKLLCLEQPEVGLAWTIRVVADFSTSGITLERLSYSAQTGLCILCGKTAYGSAAFSVVSPDGKDFIIDQVSCFQPQAEPYAANFPADQLARLADEELYPVMLQDAQLSPGGLYLLLWSLRRADHANVMYLLNLDTGKLSEITVPDELSQQSWRSITWCEGKTLLLETTAGSTKALQLTGWDD